MPIRVPRKRFFWPKKRFDLTERKIYNHIRKEHYMKDKVLFTILAIAALIFAGSFIGTKMFKASVQKNLIKLLASEIEDVDLSKVADGTYSGNYKVFPISVKVKVAVKDHQITSIEYVEHKSGKGAPAEAIRDNILEEQSLEVDVISGATYSSKAILKAVRNALTR